MQYLKYGDYYFMAVGEEFVKQVSLYNFQFGIKIVAIRNSEHEMLNTVEITEEDFNKAERRCRKMMFAARQLFNPSKSLVA